MPSARCLPPSVKAWIADLNLTAFKTVAAVFAALFVVVATMLGLIVCVAVGRDIGPGVLAMHESLLLFLAGWLGITAFQFWTQRATDREYAAIRSRPPVGAAVQSAETVNVQQGGAQGTAQGTAQDAPAATPPSSEDFSDAPRATE